jgi:hypothetical protein
MSREPVVKKGDLVEWDGKTCCVLKRRQVTGLAMFQTSDYEVCLEAEGGLFIGWVGVNEVEKVSSEENDS